MLLAVSLSSLSPPTPPLTVSSSLPALHFVQGPSHACEGCGVRTESPSLVLNECACVCVCLSVYWRTCLCKGVYKCKVGDKGPPQVPFLEMLSTSFQTGSLISLGLTSQERLVGQRTREIGQFVSTSQVLGLKAHATMLGFYMDTDDPTQVLCL